MSECTNCGSERLLTIDAKCNDMCILEFMGASYSGYVPRDCGVGGGDYIDMTVCLECGKVQDSFPRDNPEFYEVEYGQ